MVFPRLLQTFNMRKVFVTFRTALTQSDILTFVIDFKHTSYLAIVKIERVVCIKHVRDM